MTKTKKMRNYFLLIMALLIAESNSFGQNNKSDSTVKVSPISISTNLNVDTIKIQNIVSKQSSIAWYKDESMPWIFAFSISILGVIINMFISNRQINENRKITLKQIKATLSTNNRQDWVKETRNVITDLLTNAKLLNAEFQEKNQNEKSKKTLHEKVTISRTKLLLLLKADKEKHQKLLSSVINFINTLDEHLHNRIAKDDRGLDIPFDNGKFMSQFEDIVEKGRDMLYDEWNKIQSISDSV